MRKKFLSTLTTILEVATGLFALKYAIEILAGLFVALFVHGVQLNTEV